jgi:SCY1-like protein 3
MGFENLWKKSEVTVDLLERSKPFRCLEAIDPNELKNNGVGIEQFAFAVLCEAVLRKDGELFLKQINDSCFNLDHSNFRSNPEC